MKSLKMDRRISHAVARGVENLESRLLLSATRVSEIPSQAVLTTAGGTSVNLGTYFTDPDTAGTVVEMQTPLGNIPVALTDSTTPLTVANFLHYINTGEYSNTIIHRVASSFVVQGGGYTPDGAHIQTFGNVQGEPGISNTTGTIAMALSSGPNSGTSEWFINLTNNNGTGTTPNLDNTSDGGPFTAFGHVIGNGMSVVNAIAALPQVDDTAQSGAFSNLPVINYSGSTTPTSVPPANMVTNNVVVLSPSQTAIQYSAVSSDPSVVSATVSNGQLTLIPAAGVTSGSSTVTVTATDFLGGTTTSTFTASVNGFSLPVNIGAGGAKTISYTDDNGTVGTVSLKGPGSATVTFTSTASLTQGGTGKAATVVGTGAFISTITTTGTTSASSLIITTKSGTKAINIGSISTDSLKSITGKGVTLTGNIAATGAIGSLTLAAAQSGNITAPSIGSLTTSGTFADNLSLTSTGVSLNKFKAATLTSGAWNLAGSANSISANSATGWTVNIAQAVKTVAIKGDLTTTASVGSINSMSVKGNLINSTFALTAAGNDLNKLSVSGAISGTTINAAGNIGTVSAGSLVSSHIYAGVGNLDVGQELPNFATDFITIESIKSVTLKSSASGDSFSNSGIAAANLGKLSLGTLMTSNNGILPGGIAAESIQSLTATANKKFSVKKVTTASNITATLATQGVTLGDFVIKLF